MSHMRADLNPDDRLYQSVGGPILPPAGGAVTPPSAATPPAIAMPATKRAWRDAFDATLALLRTWRARQLARRELAAIDAHTLRDIGIAPELVDFELDQPFWRPLRNWRD